MLNEKINNKTYSTNNTENIPIGDCVAKAIRQALTHSRHDWQYCFLKRGGDSGEHYLTAEEILNASEHLACHLRAIIPVSNPVILSLEHGPNFLISLIACFFANRIVIPMPVPRFELHIARAEHILKITGNAYILTKNNYFNLFNSGTLPSLIQNRFIDFEILMNSPYDKNSASQTQNKRPTPNTPVVIQFTSGSTNLPKGV
ncbi:AMP-binding protein, partial [Rheinheimera baltica]|uniref:AMP-binding protein n=1 Tax=Rheinheimera baltica TaxID=67576 RepID=UPI00273DFE8C